MNYLAHLYLSTDDADSLIGSLLGDFLKGRVDTSLPAKQRHGVLLHRLVDSYTDAHPVVHRSKSRIRPPFRRYAGILVDMFFDHYLARQWSDYSPLSLEDFAQRVHQVLFDHLVTFPERMQRSMSYLLQNDLLLSYRDIDGTHRALMGIEQRLKRPSGLRHAIDEFRTNYRELEADFREFFPQLIEYAELASQTIVDTEASGTARMRRPA